MFATLYIFLPQRPQREGKQCANLRKVYMVDAFANLNYITTNLLIDKQYEDLKNSGHENDFHFAVKDNRFILLEKSNWLIGRLWFQFQVFMGWINTSPESNNFIRTKINRLKSTHEVQKVLLSLTITLNESEKTNTIEILSSLIDKKIKKSCKTKRMLEILKL